MNTGQVLLVIAALTLLSIVALSVNSLIVSKTTTILQAEAYLAAVTIGQSMLDEIMVARFDSAVLGTKKVFPGQAAKFTPVTYFGPEVNGTSGNERTLVSLPESPDTATIYGASRYYDDIDDYHCYKRYYYSEALGVFTVTDSIFYWLEGSDATTSSQTFYKKILVTVRHPNLAFDDNVFNPWGSRYYLQISDVTVYRRYY
ncbi:MAG: hypothetical protein C0417_09790 [Chlorobiaceae bacterium]|nr:hypothetical protein [Chlorobiaceae bacterium]